MLTQVHPTANVVAFLLKGSTVKPKRPQPTVPRVDDTLALHLDWVQTEDDMGVSRTPMAKIRFNTANWRWEQVPIMEAGMLVFFNRVPDVGDTGFRITSIVPNGRACYAEPE